MCSAPRPARWAACARKATWCHCCSTCSAGSRPRTSRWAAPATPSTRDGKLVDDAGAQECAGRDRPGAMGRNPLAARLSCYESASATAALGPIGSAAAGGAVPRQHARLPVYRDAAARPRAGMEDPTMTASSGGKRMVTGLFDDAASAERAYQACMERGYELGEVNVLMSEVDAQALLPRRRPGHAPAGHQRRPRAASSAAPRAAASRSWSPSSPPSAPPWRCPPWASWSRVPSPRPWPVPAPPALPPGSSVRWAIGAFRKSACGTTKRACTTAAS